MKYDYLIAGAGLAGCVTAERIASRLEKKVLIIDKRNHIGGHCYDYFDDGGVLIHKYGPHAFHTNSKKVWDYLSEFTGWNNYNHIVLARIEKKNIPLPFNINSIFQLFENHYAQKLTDLLINTYGAGMKIPILQLQKTTNDELKFLADYIYKNVFLGYNLKQWSLKPEELDYSVSSRVPVHISRDNRYFQDRYQGIPVNGYTALFEKLVENPNIHIELNTEFKSSVNDIDFDKLIFTGPIDYYFDYIHGELPYRTQVFDLKTYDFPWFQENSQINYPNDEDFIRITEFKHFMKQKTEKTTVAYEYSKPTDKDSDEPYYPIPQSRNHDIFAKYRKEAEKLLGNVFFLGRLADYKYYNMDEVTGAALQLFEQKIAKSL